MITLLPVETRPESLSKLRVVACPRPFSIDRADFLETPGATIAGLLGRCGLQPDRIFARVFLDDRLIPEAEWERVIPVAGQLLTVRAIPTDGGGKDALRIVAMIAVVVLAVVTAQYYAVPLAGTLGVSEAVATAIIVSTVSIAGSLAINALIPPTAPKMSQLGGVSGAESPSLSVTGARNNLALYGPVPRVLGRHRIFPPYGAKPFTEIIGTDQYLRLLFVLGYGPLTISDLKIGTTPLEQFTDVQYEIRYGWPTDAPLTLYTDDVQEDALSVLLTQAGGGQVRVSRELADELSVDIVFPQGLVQFDAQGNKGPKGVEVQVEYRPIAGGAWTAVDNLAALQASCVVKNLTVTAVAAGDDFNPWTVLLLSGTPGVERVGSQFIVTVALGVTTEDDVKAALNAAFSSLITVTGGGAGTYTGGDVDFTYNFSGGRDQVPTFSLIEARASLVRRGIRWTVATPGTYEVRLTRTTADSTDPLVRDQVYWGTFRTIRKRSPLTTSGLALVALRIKATDQLNGVVDQFSCVAQSIAKDWDGSAWVTRATSNPASLYREVLQGPANARPLADSRLDLTQLQAWSAECTSKGFAFNQVIDFRTTVFQLLQDIAAAGRARFTLRDGKYATVRDLSQTTPIQHFSPRNSWGFRGTKVFVTNPHALKVRFINPDQDWQQDEVVVYDDGYSAATATIFETIELTGVTSASQAWKLGRYHLAVARLRPETYEISTDIENLVCTAGDLVKLVHDIPQFGLGAARIKSLTTDGGGNATGMTMDDVVPMEAGKSYAVRIRKQTGATLLSQITTVAGEQSTVTFTVAIPAASVPAVGDLVLFGILNSESVDCLVKAIDPGPDFTAKLTLVDAAPAVLTADSGTIPPFDSQITVAPFLQQQPAQPILDQVRSDEEVLLRDVDGALVSRILIVAHFASGATVPVEYVETRRRVSGSTGNWVRQTFALAGDTIELSLLPVEDGVAYDLLIRTVGAQGQTSDWVQVLAHTVIGKTSKPADITTLLYEQGKLRWLYPSPPLDLAGFKVRAHAGDHRSWDDAIPMHDNLVTGTTFALFADSGVRTYLVKAVDVAGNESAIPAVVVLNLGDAPTDNIVETLNEHPAFSGTKVGGTVIGSQLKATQLTLFWSADENLAWTLDPNLFWPGGAYSEMSYTFEVVPPNDWLPGKLLLSLTIQAAGYTIEYRPDVQKFFWSNDVNLFWTTDSALFWSAKGSFIPWPGVLEPLTRQVYEIRITAEGGLTQAIISALSAIFDMPDLVQVFEDLAVASGGTRLTPTLSFKNIKYLTLTLQNDGGTARTLRYEDKDNLTLGPLVKALDSGGTPTTALIDATMGGY